MAKKLVWYWHIHHDALLEPLTEPLKNRIDYIKKEKPKDEVKLRLKLIKPVKGKLPKGLIEAWQGYEEARQKLDEAWWKLDEAWQKLDEARQKLEEARQKLEEARQKLEEAWQKLDEARQKLEEARQKYLPQLKALHKKECGCGYDFKRQTIFSKKNGLEK